MKSSIISTTADSISSGGTVTGDLKITGDLEVEGGGAITVDTATSGNVSIIDTTASSATEGGNLMLGSNDGAVMADGHRLGVLSFVGAEATGGVLTTGARIEAIANATWSDTENSGYLRFFTTDGNASQSEVLRLTDSGNIAIAATKRLYFDGVTGGGHTYIDEESNDLLRIGVGASEVMKLDNNSRVSLSNNDSGTSNTVFGKLAGRDLAAGGNYNTFIGEDAGLQNTVGVNNIAIGHNTMDDSYTNATTDSENDDNIFIGVHSGGGTWTAAASTTGYSVKKNIAIGSGTMAGALSESLANIAVGYEALNDLTSGARNIAIGANAADAITSAGDNIAIGNNALGAAVTAGFYNIALGTSALDTLTTADRVIAIGYAAGQGDLQTGGGTDPDGADGTILMGYQAGQALTTGAASLFIGYEAGRELTTASSNTGIGFKAMADTSAAVSQNNTMIGANTGSGTWATAVSGGNTAVGSDTMKAAMNTADNNTTIGYNSMSALINGGNNAAIGKGAMSLLTSGSKNAALGAEALSTHVSGNSNIAIGYQAMHDTDAGSASDSSSDNVMIGDEAGGGAWQNSVADGNIAIGAHAFSGAINGSDDCIAIGRNAMTGDVSSGKTIAIGTNALITLTTGAENIAIGSDSMKYVRHGSKNVIMGHTAMDESNVSTFADSTCDYDDGTTITHDANANIVQGLYVTGTGIPDRSYIVSLTDGTHFVLNNSTTGGAVTNGTLTFWVEPRETVAIGYGTMGGDWVAGAVYDNTTLGALTLSGNLNGASKNTALGNRCLSSATASHNNTMAGWHAGWQLTSGDENTAVGSNAMAGVVTGDNNVAMGFNAGYGITDGVENTLMGKDAGYAITGTDNCTLIGYQAGYDLANDAAVGTVAVGYKAGTNIVSGIGNTVVGYQAMKSNQTSDYNTAVGQDALFSTNKDGSTGNTAVGYNAAKDVTSGGSNTAMGYQAMENIATGAQNSVFGWAALDAANGTESDNIAIGASAMGAVDEGTNSGSDTVGANGNIAIGKEALLGGNLGDTTSSDGSHRACDYNVAIGWEALKSTTTNSQTGTIAIGKSALGALTSGGSNTVIGHNAANDITTGGNNTIIGYGAVDGAMGSNSEDSQYNTVLGSGAMGGVWANEQLDGCVAIGYSAMGTGAIDGSESGVDGTVAIGMSALDDLTTGGANVMIGYQAGQHVTTGDNNTVIGYQAFHNLNAGNNSRASDDNVFIGKNVGGGVWADNASSKNTAVGTLAMDANMDNSQANTVMGYQAGTAVTSGGYNVFMGNTAGGNVTTGSYNVAIGDNANLPVSSKYQVNIGHYGGVRYATGRFTLDASYTTVAAGDAAHTNALFTIPPRALIKRLWVTVITAGDGTHDYTIEIDDTLNVASGTAVGGTEILGAGAASGHWKVRSQATTDANSDINASSGDATGATWYSDNLMADSSSGWVSTNEMGVYIVHAGSNSATDQGADPVLQLTVEWMGSF